MEMSDWLLFSSIALAAALSPGPAVLLVTSHSFAYGLQRSVATILGNITGLFLMSAFAVAGLSAIMLRSTTVFNLVKFIGAAYLIYLGIKLIRKGFGAGFDDTQSAQISAQPPSSRVLYGHGILVALSNPKAIAFTTALFPQFVDASLPVLPQFSILVLTTMVISFCCLLGYAYLSASARNRASHRGLSGRYSKLFGLIFIISGGLLAGSSPRQV